MHCLLAIHRPIISYNLANYIYYLYIHTFENIYGMYPVCHTYTVYTYIHTFINIINVWIYIFYSPHTLTLSTLHICSLRLYEKFAQ